MWPAVGEECLAPALSLCLQQPLSSPWAWARARCDRVEVVQGAVTPPDWEPGLALIPLLVGSCSGGVGKG